MAAKKTPDAPEVPAAPATHIAVPVHTWNSLCGFLEGLPWRDVDALRGELLATKCPVSVND